MGSILKFGKETFQNNDEPIDNSTPLSQEDFDFLEDMMFLSDLATESEIDCVCFDDPTHVVTKKGEIKLNPNMKDSYNYIQNRNQQKINTAKQNSRKAIFKLV